MQVGFIPVECRCKALRGMMQEACLLSPTASEERNCWHAQGDFAAAIVMEAEDGVRTIHGMPFCYALGADD